MWKAGSWQQILLKIKFKKKNLINHISMISNLIMRQVTKQAETTELSAGHTSFI